MLDRLSKKFADFIYDGQTHRGGYSGRGGTKNRRPPRGRSKEGAPPPAHPLDAETTADR